MGKQKPISLCFCEHSYGIINPYSCFCMHAYIIHVYAKLLFYNILPFSHVGTPHDGIIRKGEGEGEGEEERCINISTRQYWSMRPTKDFSNASNKENYPSSLASSTNNLTRQNILNIRF